MKLEVWVEDDNHFKSLLREVTQRDGKWRVTYKRDGKRVVTFTGKQGSERAMLFKLAYVEPKGPTAPPENHAQKIKRLLKMIRESGEYDDQDPDNQITPHRIWSSFTEL